MCSGRVTFLTFGLLSKHQIPHTGFRTRFITVAAEQIRQTGVADLRCSIDRSLGQVHVVKGPHVSSRQETASWVLPSSETRKRMNQNIKSIAIFSPTPLPSPVRCFVVTLWAEQKVDPEFSVVRHPSHGSQSACSLKGETLFSGCHYRKILIMLQSLLVYCLS